MRNLNKIASAFCMAALGLLTLTGCEGGDLYEMDTPDWITEKIDSINNANNSSDEELEGMMEDVYTIGETDYSSGWWTAFSKYYVVPENTKWNAVFDLNLNPDDNTYYKNFALIISNDADRGSADYKEYGAIRFDATGDSASYNSQWGSAYYYLPFKYTTSTLLLAPDANNEDENVQQLGGEVTLTVDRSKTDSFVVKMTNGTVTKTYTQPYALSNLNTDQTDTNIRCFLVPEGSYINFLETNIVPIGGTTSADDKDPVSMVLQNVPDEVSLGTSLDSAMANVSAVVTFEEGVTKTVTASELIFSAINDMNVAGEKTLVAIYNKTYKGENCDNPIVASATFNVVQKISSISVTTEPTYTTYYYYTSAATSGLSGRTLAFDPTGMVVTATYEDGSTGVVDNDKLSYTSVPAEVGSHNVTISTDNGVTTTLTVKVAESTSSAVTNSTSLVGLEDNTTGWWSAFTDEFNVPSGATRSLTFTNYTDMLNNWDNFVVILRNTSLAEYAVVRSDDYGWGNGYSSCTHAGTASADWASWLSAMNGATVTVYVTNCGNGTADVQAVMKGTNGTTYTQYYLGISTVDPTDLNFALTCDHCHFVFSSTSAKRHFKAAGKRHAYRR